jgi:heptosyltransferase-2
VKTPRSILIVQTAFLGDVILTLPLAQALTREWPDSSITFVVLPGAASVLDGHPAVRDVITYDKKRSQRGLFAMLRLASGLRRRRFDVALVPHRSLRSALVVAAAGIPRRIGFDRSAGRMLLTDVVRYREDAHEIDRNLSLLAPLGIRPPESRPRPELHPRPADSDAVDAVLHDHRQRVGDFDPGSMVGLAPGSVWKTKRWPAEKFLALARALRRSGYHIVLVGGPEDRALCGIIAEDPAVTGLNAAGKLTPIQSAELARRCRVLVSNDSAPAHLAAGVGTPVVTIFGATVPSFGFAARGPRDRVIETPGLACRPCSIHGGHRCPIGTFVCMERIIPQAVHDAVLEIDRAPDSHPA